MKRIFCILVGILCLIGIHSDITFGACNFNGGDIKGSLDACLSDSEVVTPGSKLTIEKGGGFNNYIIHWTNMAGSFLMIFAVGAIVYGGFMLVISIGDEERVKKGKDIIKWGMLGFVAIIASGAIIRLIIELAYGI